MKDAKISPFPTGAGTGRVVPWTNPDSQWRFITCGQGNVDFDLIIQNLNAVGYKGPLVHEHEKDRAPFLPELARSFKHLQGTDFLPGDGFEDSMKGASGGAKKETVAEIVGFNPTRVSVPSAGIPGAQPPNP